MKILRSVLVVAGVVLIGIALYNVFFPQELLDKGSLEISTEKGKSNQEIAMIGLGVIAVITGAFMKRR